MPLENKISSEQNLLANVAYERNQIEDMLRSEAERRLAMGKIDGALSVLNSYESPSLLSIYSDIALQYGRDAEAQSALEKLARYTHSHQNYHLSELVPIQIAIYNSSNGRKAIEPYKQKLYELYSNGDFVSFKIAALLANYCDTLLAPYLPIDTDQKLITAQPFNFWTSIPIIDKSFIQVYPTPASNEVSISGLLTDCKVITLHISDSKGSTIYKEEIKGTEVQKTINTQSWGNGIYIVRLLSDIGADKSSKIIINH
jgi:hypothetical protein